MEGARGTGGQNISGKPALNAAVQRNQLGRLMHHVADHVLGIDLAVMDRLDLQLQHVGHLIRGDQLRSEGEEGGKILHDGQVAGIAAYIIVALEDRFLGHVENRGVSDDDLLPVLLGNVTAVLAQNDAQLRFGGGLLRLFEGWGPDLIAGSDQGISLLKKAARESGRGGGADISRMIQIVQADAKDAAGGAVERSVYHLIGGNQPGKGFKLPASARIVPGGQAGDLPRADQIVHFCFPCGALGRVERLNREYAARGHDAGNLPAILLDGCKSHNCFLLQIF